MGNYQRQAMKKKFSVYGNCQAQALAKTLLESEEFSRRFEYLPINAVQTLREEEIDSLVATLRQLDLLLYQPVSDRYHIPKLSTSNLLSCVSDRCRVISFPSLYFNGYFPHLDTLKGIVSILNLVHDYNIIYGFILGLDEVELIELISSEKLYDRLVSNNLANRSIEELESREYNKTDIKVSDYILNNYKTNKLFNQFNHPRRPVFEYLFNRILDMLSFEPTQFLSQTTGYLDAISTPVYKSTYVNLDLSFTEDFLIYSSMKNCNTHIAEVVKGFYSTYRALDKAMLYEQVLNRKPFVIEAFRKLGINTSQFNSTPLTTH